MWDPEIIAMKQRALMSQVYGENISVPFWHPNQKKKARPYWTKWVPSAAALSYNFAVDRYHPLVAKKGYIPTPFVDDEAFPRNFNWRPIDDDEFVSNLKHMKVIRDSPGNKSRQYSYHLSRSQMSNNTQKGTT